MTNAFFFINGPHLTNYGHISNVSLHFGHLLPILTNISRIRSLRPNFFFQCIIHCIPIIHVCPFSICMWLSLLYPKLENCDILSTGEIQILRVYILKIIRPSYELLFRVIHKKCPGVFLVDFSFKFKWNCIHFAYTQRFDADHPANYVLGHFPVRTRRPHIVPRPW